MVTINQLPPSSFWNNEATPLQVINEGDLRLPQLLQRIGADELPINVLATSDRNEIIRRQELSQWLMKNPSARQGFFDCCLEPATSSQTDKFLDEYNPERTHSSLFMEKLHEIIAIIESSSSAPKAVREFVATLRKTMPEAAANEQEFATVTIDHLHRAAEISGIVDFVRPPFSSKNKSYVDTTQATVSGYRLHCYRPLGYRPIKLSDWFDKHPLLGAPVRAVANAWNRRQDQVIYGGQIIETLPNTLQEIIQQTGEDILINDDMQSEADWRLTFAFSYTGSELRVKIIDMQVNYASKKTVELRCKAGDHERSIMLQHDLLTKFPGYSQKQLRHLEKKDRQIYMQSENDHLARVHQAFIHTNLPAGADEFFSKDGKLIEDSDFEHEFRDYALRSLFQEDGRVKDLYKEVTAYRQWVFTQIELLGALSQVVSNMQQMAQTNDWPLAMPEVLDDSKHMLRFTSLIPTQLIGKTTSTGQELGGADLIPIQDFTKLNGKLVFLTGRNAGGKTVTQETLAETLYLAQCGLPTFGCDVAFNPKEVLAVVFIERGDGSTAELLLRKYKATLEVVSESNPARTLVILDELGTGTQAIDGDQLARKVLARLQRIGCSVLASTQIMSLAEHAEVDLGALMFQIDRDRYITPGIGHGDIAGLAEQVGLSKFLH